MLGNKCDIASPEQIAEFRAFIEEKGLVFLPVSAATRQGLDKLPGVYMSGCSSCRPSPCMSRSTSGPTLH